MTSSKRLELLAPAGSEAALHAAVSAGADAVYLGLGEFNARRNADNFSLENLQSICDYAHLRGVSAYLTMNVEILPGELASALDCASRAYEAGADALIVQDIGLAAELAYRAPHIPLHASTQMNVHSAAGIEACAQLGMQRVTLARELSLAEVRELADTASAFGMEVECFAHGALCICYSGQCLMSSMIGGRSANRGLCAQACRLEYDLHRDGRDDALPAPGNHLLSPRDLCAIGLLGELADAGVASLKIEGRMKSADYVHEVVSVYREVIDSGRAPTEAHMRRLSEAFSRGFTAAYLENERGNEMMSYGRPNNRGVFAGRVGRLDGKVAEVKTELSLHAGDIVEFWTNKGHFAASVPENAAESQTVRIPVEQRVGKGDRVFRVRNAQTAFSDDPLEPKVALSGHVDLHEGKPALVEFFAPAGFKAQATGDIVEAARTKAVTEQEVRDHVNRLGQTPFALPGESLSVELSDGVGIGFSQLHRLRARALEDLQKTMLASYRGRSDLPPAVVDAAEGRRRTAGSPSARDALIAAWATNPGCARAAKRAGARELYVPLLNFRRKQAQLQGVRQDEAEQAGYPKQCIMALPAVDHDPVPGTREHSSSFDLWDYVREGKPVFADSLASAIRALNVGALVEIGPHVPVTNRASLEFFAGMGVRRVWLSPELTLGQIAALAEGSPVELGLFVSGSQELMICEHCLLMSQGPCGEQCESCPRRSVAHHLTDKKGFEFPVVTDMMGRSHLFNGVELDAVPNLCDLLDIGVSAFMVDTTLMDKKTAESAVGRAARALELARTERRSVPKRAGATTGHLFRGVK